MPHIHAKYQDASAVFTITDGKLLEGSMPLVQTKLIQAWIAIHTDELLADWELAIDGKSMYRIDPLK
ncbi:hypothetical protein FACS1894162_5680 [Bacteroidia bacterium]|nr:hypothetical protein FACS1894162_5680 [Bacteroidia bacterium]